MWWWLSTLFAGCGSSGPSAEVVCASMNEAAVTLGQAAAVEATQAKLLGQLQPRAHPPVDPDAYDRQGEPRRSEGQHRGKVLALCEPLVRATRGLAAHAPAPHAQALTKAADALAPYCTDEALSDARRAEQAVREVQGAAFELEGTCKASTAEPETRLICATTDAVLTPFLASLALVEADARALHDARQVFRQAVHGGPFESGRLEQPLEALGQVEGAYAARCSNLVKLIDSHTARVADEVELADAHAALQALHQACEAPPFDARVPAADPQDDRANEHVATLAARAAATIEAYRTALAACAAPSGG